MQNMELELKVRRATWESSCMAQSKAGFVISHLTKSQGSQRTSRQILHIEHPQTFYVIHKLHLRPYAKEASLYGRQMGLPGTV
jgi:hypothetical protein